MSSKTELFTIIVGGIVSAVSIGYAWAMKKRAKTAEEIAEKKIDQMFEDGKIDIRQSVIDNSVERAIEKKTGRYLDTSIKTTCDRVADKCETKIHDAINERAKNVVDEEFKTASEKARNEIDRQVREIDIKGLKRDIRESAEKKMVEKLDGSMDDILDTFNKNLNNVSSIYKSIADNFGK